MAAVGETTTVRWDERPRKVERSPLPAVQLQTNGAVAVLTFVSSHIRLMSDLRAARLTGLMLPQVLDERRRHLSEMSAEGTIECLGSSERRDQKLRRSEAFRHQAHEKQTQRAKFGKGQSKCFQWLSSSLAEECGAELVLKL